MSAIIVARLLPEAARGERGRVCHMFRVAETGSPPMVLRALCGAEIRPGDAEILTSITGMPCIACLTSPFASEARRPSVESACPGGSVLPGPLA